MGTGSAGLGACGVLGMLLMLCIPFCGLLALILGYISKYSEDGKYLFSTNINYPVFLFMSIIVALFIGLTVSAEEIYRDRKILEREKFLSLSRLSYLLSKINFLFVLSAIQTLSFVIVASLILEVRGMLFQQWLILFSVACFGNILGLNISAGMRTAVSIYILIPLLLVPQLILGGAMIKFDDLHKSFTRKKYVPFIGDMMTSRWAYESLMVTQFKDNRFEKQFYMLRFKHRRRTASDIDRRKLAGVFRVPRYKFQLAAQGVDVCGHDLAVLA
jgi:hypothetical protein